MAPTDEDIHNSSLLVRVMQRERQQRMVEAVTETKLMAEVANETKHDPSEEEGTPTTAVGAEVSESKQATTEGDIDEEAQLVRRLAQLRAARIARNPTF